MVFSVELDRASDQPKRPDDGMLAVHHHAPRVELRTVQDLGDASHAPDRDSRFVQHSFPRGNFPGSEDRLQQGAQFRPLPDPVRVLLELRTVQFRRGDRAEPLPEGVVADRHDDVPVGGLEALVGREGGMVVAAADRLFSRNQVSLRLVAERRHHGVEERHVHPAAAAVALPREECGEDARTRHHPGADVGERRPQLGGRPLRGSREAHPAGLALHDGVVAGLRRKRPVLSVGGDRAPDEPGMAALHVLGSKPQPRQRPGPEVLDERVAFRDEAGERCRALLGLEVQDHALLAPVDREEVGGLAAAEGRSPGAGVVPARRFDLDHLGAEVGQHHGGVGPGQDPGEIQNPDSRQGGSPAGRAGAQRSAASVAVSARSRMARAPSMSDKPMLSGGEIRTQLP